jgi:hypothetical protein
VLYVNHQDTQTHTYGWLRLLKEETRRRKKPKERDRISSADDE